MLHHSRTSPETIVDTRLLEGGLPSWVPRDVLHYIQHVEFGASLRAVARVSDCHPSTVLRQVRRLEALRDDPLVDAAIRRLERSIRDGAAEQKDRSKMTENQQLCAQRQSDESFERAACEALRSLSESNAIMAVVPDMEKAVIVQDAPDGTTRRLAVVDTEIANAMALKQWISCQSSGRIARYGISSLGRAELPRLLSRYAGADTPRSGIAAAAGLARGQGASDETSEQRKQRRVRYSQPETPLSGLARRRDKTGKPFLDDTLVAAGERLREDFELSQMAPGATQNWEKLITGKIDGSPSGSREPFGPTAARDRVIRALRDLGPGLADVALRCCCYLEGLETTEKRMGWSARSGKIVLRIALQRLARFYSDSAEGAEMIG